MIVLLRPDAADDAVKELYDAVKRLGLDVIPLDDAKGSGFEVVGGDRGKVLALREAPAVAEILTRRTALVGGEPLWPHFALRVTIVALLLLAGLVLLAAYLPPALGDPAPGGGLESAEWYLRPLEAFLALFPDGGRSLGGALFLLFWIAFIFWPFLDRADTSGPAGRRMARLVRILGIAFLLLLALLWVKGAP